MKILFLAFIIIGILGFIFIKSPEEPKEPKTIYQLLIPLPHGTNMSHGGAAGDGTEQSGGVGDPVPPISTDYSGSIIWQGPSIEPHFLNMPCTRGNILYVSSKEEFERYSSEGLPSAPKCDMESVVYKGSGGSQTGSSAPAINKFREGGQGIRTNVKYSSPRFGTVIVD